MSDLPTSEQVERLIEGINRIADAAQSYAAADPLTVLHEAMQGADAGDNSFASMPAQEPREPYASNGATVMYKHPRPDLEIVLRQDDQAVGGYSVSVERANGE